MYINKNNLAHLGQWDTQNLEFFVLLVTPLLCLGVTTCRQSKLCRSLGLCAQLLSHFIYRMRLLPFYAQLQQQRNQQKSAITLMTSAYL